MIFYETTYYWYSNFLNSVEMLSILNKFSCLAFGNKDVNVEMHVQKSILAKNYQFTIIIFFESIISNIGKYRKKLYFS